MLLATPEVRTMLLEPRLTLFHCRFVEVVGQGGRVKVWRADGVRLARRRP